MEIETVVLLAVNLIQEMDIYIYSNVVEDKDRYCHESCR